MIKKLLIFFIVLLYSNLYLYAQDIHFDFPSFPNQPVKIDYFKGNKADSLSVILDASGQGELSSPIPYGLIRLTIPASGIIEFITGEPQLKLVCKGDIINPQTVSFPGSKENEFLLKTFMRKSQLMSKQGWLQSGVNFYTQGSDMMSLIEKENSKTSGELKLLDDSIAHSTLFAARFIQWLEFSNRLFELEQQYDAQKAGRIRNEMETTADMPALYASGQLWGNIHYYYLSMFNKSDASDKQEAYAGSINKIITRYNSNNNLQEEILSGSVSECERFGWENAEKIILWNFINTYPQVKIKNSNLQKLVAALQVSPGNKAPSLVGMKSFPNWKRNTTLLIFYEAGCGSCDYQITELKKNYAELQAKGVNIISISSDEAENVYDFHAQSFPWTDKLCDYKGFEGDNFKNYGVIATPTIFVIDNNGIIQGKYAKLEDTELIKN